MQGPWSYDDSMGGHVVATSGTLDSAASGDGGTSVLTAGPALRPEPSPGR